MKNLLNIVGITSLALLFCGGCQRSDQTESENAMPGETAETPSIEETVTENVETPSIEETVTETAETAKQVISEANAEAQKLLTQAQELVGEKKYEEAGTLLQKLADFELTPEQQKMLDDLTAAVQKALQSEALKEGTKAVGNLLGGEK